MFHNVPIRELEWECAATHWLCYSHLEEQGFHRTGTAVDKISGDWLANEVRQIGLKPMREERLHRYTSGTGMAGARFAEPALQRTL